MVNDNMENINDIDYMMHQIWRCVNLLSDSYPNEEEVPYQLVLFMISIHKDSMLPDSRINDYYDLKSSLDKTVGLDFNYSKIFSVFESKIENLPIGLLNKLLHDIWQIDINLLKKNFNYVFETVLNKLIDIQGKRSGDSILPEEVSRFITFLAKLDNNASVYNPFAGLASFGVYLKDGQQYYGQEINPSVWAIGQLRLNAHGKEYNSRYEIDNSISNWGDFQKYDLIVSAPPFKLSVPKNHHSVLTGESYKEVEDFLIDKGIRSLKENGKLIAIFPISFLLGDGHQRSLKQSLIENGLIDTVIYLPGGLLTNTTIPVTIVVFKNEQTRPGFIKIVDGLSFLRFDGNRKMVLNYKELQELIDADFENDNLKYVSIEEIIENDLDLRIDRYFLSRLEFSKLSSFSKFLTPNRAPNGIEMKCVRPSELKNDVFDCVLTAEELTSKIIEDERYNVIEESCVLISGFKGDLRPTYFKYTGKPVAISNIIYALSIDEKIVDPIYLINEFSSDYVKTLLDKYTFPFGFLLQPLISRKELGNLVFKLPSKKEQLAKIGGVLEMKNKFKELEVEREKLLQTIKREDVDSSTTLSHVLGKPLLNIGSSLDIIQNTLLKVDPNWKNIIINERRQFKMSDAFDSIFKNLTYIQEMLDENVSLLKVSSFQLSEMEFINFLSEFVKDDRKSLNGKIELILDIHDDIIQEMGNQVFIKGNGQKLRIVFMNLIDNAKSHAFVEGYKDHKLKIEILPFVADKVEALNLNYELDPDKSYVEIKVFNTGKRFPKDFSLDDYIRKNFSVGSTQNKGLGGYEINEILKVHNSGKKSLNIMSLEEGQKYSSMVSFIIPII